MSDRKNSNDNESLASVSSNSRLIDSGIASYSTNVPTESLNRSSGKTTSYSSLKSTTEFPISELESAILKSDKPLDIIETEEISVLGQRGIWINKNEVKNWQGPIPFADYPINNDPNPEIIRKNFTNEIEYLQEIANLSFRKSSCFKGTVCTTFNNSSATIETSHARATNY